VRQQSSTPQLALLPWLVLLLSLLIGGYVWWLNDSHHKESEQSARQDAALRATQLADAMAGQVDSLFLAMDLGLLQVREVWRRDPTQVPHIAQAVFEALPEDLAAHISIVDAEGFVGYSTLDDGTNTAVGDLDHFRSLKAGDDRLLISDPMQSQLNQGWSFTVSRPVIRDGRFAGAVNLAVKTNAMAALLGRLDLNRDDVVALVQVDGTFQARSLDNPTAMGRSVAADSPFLGSDAPERGQIHLPGTPENVGRIFAWHRAPMVDQIVLVGLSETAVLAPLLAGNHSPITAAWASTVGLAGLLLAVLIVKV